MNGSDDAARGFRQLGERRAFQGHLFSVATVRFRDPDGADFERDVVRHPGAVSIVAVAEDRTVTLVRQVRAPIGGTVLEAPAGTCDVDGEDPEATARRELAEEAGLEAAHLERLGTVLNSPGYTDQRTIVFLATGLSPCAPGPEGVEERWMTLETASLDDVEHLVDTGRLMDATTIAGLLLARTRLDGRATRGPDQVGTGR